MKSDEWYVFDKVHGYAIVGPMSEASANYYVSDQPEWIRWRLLARGVVSDGTVTSGS